MRELSALLEKVRKSFKGESIQFLRFREGANALKGSMCKATEKLNSRMDLKK